MTHTLLLALTLAASTSATPSPTDVVADTLSCTVTAAPKAKRRCSVVIPERRSMAACSVADKRANRCTAHAGRVHAVWVAGGRGASCKISSKRSDWKTKMTLSMSKKSMKNHGASCVLHVAIR